jgi:hypothetical protein
MLMLDSTTLLSRTTTINRIQHLKFKGVYLLSSGSAETAVGPLAGALYPAKDTFVLLQHITCNHNIKKQPKRETDGSN